MTISRHMTGLLACALLLTTSASAEWYLVCSGERVCCHTHTIKHSRHHGEILEMRYDRGPRHHHYVNTANSAYNPDMTTGDDEIMTDSDMNNQY